MQKQELGTIRIADEVVAIIAGLAAAQVEGVAGMEGEFSSGLAGMFSRTAPSNGVEVDVGEESAAVDLHLVMDYRVQIPEVAWKTQENVRTAIMDMTGLEVSEVNIHIQGIHFPEEQSETKDQSGGS